MQEFRKAPYTLYSVVLLNLCLCFFGFSVTFVKMTTEWGKVTLCTLWAMLFFLSSGNQGFVWRNPFTIWGDRAVAGVILVLYSYFYWNTMEWWHWTSGTLALLGYIIIGTVYRDQLKVHQYANLVNIWHIWIMIQLFLVPYSIPEGPLF